MKKTILIIILLISGVVISQSSNSAGELKKEFITLINYTPNALLSPNEILKPLSKKLKSELNSIAKLSHFYKLKEDLKLSKTEIKILEDQINQLAVALYLENKSTQIEISGGYSGCPDDMVSNKIINGNKVSILFFCGSGCIVNKEMEKFVEIFNNRVTQLITNS